METLAEPTDKENKHEGFSDVRRYQCGGFAWLFARIGVVPKQTRIHTTAPARNCRAVGS